jgi:hypothetical protein
MDSSVSLGWLFTAVRVALCIDLLFTYVLTFNPGREVIERSLGFDREEIEQAGRPGLKTFLGGTSTDWKRNLVRVVLAGATLLIAQLKFFGIVTNLVGIPLSILGFVIPPLMYIRVHRLIRQRPAKESTAEQGTKGEQVQLQRQAGPGVLQTTLLIILAFVGAAASAVVLGYTIKSLVADEQPTCGAA